MNSPILQYIETFCFSLLMILFLVIGIHSISPQAKEEREQSHIYQQLHQAPECIVTKTKEDGSPLNYNCKHVYVEADAALWERIKNYKPTDADIKATEFSTNDKNITWSDEKVIKKYQPLKD